MAERLLKVKGTNLFYENYAESEISLVGTLTGGSGTAGKLKVKGIYLYYIDYNSDERKLLGWLTGNTGTAGKLKIKGDFIRYIDYSGDEREIKYLLVSLWHSTTLAYLTKNNASYSTAHNAAVGSAYGWGALSTPHMGQSHRSDYPRYFIHRGVIAFDTSSIPDNAVITRAWLSMEVSIARSGGDFDVVIVRGDFHIPPVGADYGALLNETTPMGNITNTAGLGDTANIYSTLNELGRAEIDKTGYTKFAVRTSMDINSTVQPSDTYSSVAWAISWWTGFGRKKLFVQYEPPV